MTEMRIAQNLRDSISIVCSFQIGSMTGRFPLPFSGPSSASKAAMDAFADVYRTEMKPFVIAHDAQSKRNADAVFAFYDEMINKKQAVQAVEKYLVPEYIQHNPIIPTTAKALGEFFNSVAVARKNLRVAVYRVIASG